MGKYMPMKSMVRTMSLVGEIRRVRAVLFKASHHSMSANHQSKQALEIKPTIS